MSDDPQRRAAIRARREPPPFRRVEVQQVEARSPRLVRVTFAGADLEGFTIEQPAASVRLLLPPRGERELAMPAWNGNEFLLPDGSRPTIRTFTPRRADPAGGRLDLEIVVHEGGAASRWVESARPGDPAAISGPGRGYVPDEDAPGFLLVGDETAIPAISQLLEGLPPDRPVRVHVEVAHPDARLDLPEHPAATVTWHDLAPGAEPGDAMGRAVREVEIPDGTRVWAAGEAAAVQRIRRHLFEERHLSRDRTSVRGYWKRGRTGT